jgi:hypothetical protein
LNGKDTSVATVKRLPSYGSIRKPALVSVLNGSGWGGDIMSFEKQHTETVLLNHTSKNELAMVLVDLINNDREVRRAILNLAFTCPNIVTQI